MTNEATSVTLLGHDGDPVEYTIAAGTVIPKNSLMQLSGSPQTVTISAADGNIFAGIASKESASTDTFTKLMCWTHLVADLKYSAGGTLGQPQKLSGVNSIADADDDTIENAGQVVGLGLETATTGTGAVLINL